MEIKENENLDSALRRFKRQISRSGTLAELRKRQHYEKPSVKPRTYKQYSDIIHKRLIPSLGEYDMDELDARVLQRYIVELSQNGNKRTGRGLAPNSVNSVILGY